ncbi:MAG: MoaD/ThiS family protein [Candidatus Heimdallarchaeota archaeon]
MPRVKILYFSRFREVIGIKEETELMQVDKATIKDLLSTLAEKHGYKFEREIFNPKTMQTGEYMFILVNRIEIEYLNGLNTELKDGDTVAIMAPVSGG